MKRRLFFLFACYVASLVPMGCEWLQNDFFSFDLKKLEGADRFTVAAHPQNSDYFLFRTDTANMGLKLSERRMGILRGCTGLESFFEHDSYEIGEKFLLLFEKTKVLIKESLILSPGATIRFLPCYVKHKENLFVVPYLVDDLILVAIFTIQASDSDESGYEILAKKNLRIDVKQYYLPACRRSFSRGFSVKNVFVEENPARKNIYSVLIELQGKNIDFSSVGQLIYRQSSFSFLAVCDMCSYKLLSCFVFTDSLITDKRHMYWNISGDALLMHFGRHIHVIQFDFSRYGVSRA